MIMTTIVFGLVIAGYVFVFMFDMYPMMYSDWFVAIVFTLPPIIATMQLGKSKAIKLYENNPVGKNLFFYIRRDHTMDMVYGSRPFKGESFFEISGIGLIHDIGSVYRIGNKNIRFILENVNHTVDVKWSNFLKWLHDEGYHSIQELQDGITNFDATLVIDEPEDPALPELVSAVKAYVPPPADKTEEAHSFIDKIMIHKKRPE